MNQAKNAYREKVKNDIRKNFDLSELESLANQYGTPLIVVSRNLIRERLALFKKYLPAVTPHYAVKCFSSEEFLSELKKLDVYLDVATSGEIDKLEKIGYDSTLAIHTHPHKRASDMKRAFDFGIRSFVFDCEEELEVMLPYKDDIKLSLRISYQNNDAHINLSYKFGVEPDNVVNLLMKAKGLGFNVNTLCFHVGSQLESPQPFKDALESLADIVDKLEQNECVIDTIDIGGGFPTEYTETVLELNKFADVINPYLDKYFKNKRIICEPGRFIAGPSAILLTSVTTITSRHGRKWAFIDDGAYGTYSDIFSGKMDFLTIGLKEIIDRKVLPKEQYVVCGPTCDSLDIISENSSLHELRRGDILITPNIGAYSWVLATEFNSIPKARVLIVD